MIIFIQTLSELIGSALTWYVMKQHICLKKLGAMILTRLLLKYKFIIETTMIGLAW